MAFPDRLPDQSPSQPDNTRRPDLHVVEAPQSVSKSPRPNTPEWFNFQFEQIMAEPNDLERQIRLMRLGQSLYNVPRPMREAFARMHPGFRF